MTVMVTCDSLSEPRALVIRFSTKATTLNAVDVASIDTIGCVGLILARRK